MEMKRTRNFLEIKVKDCEQLQKLEFPVPESFVITTEQFKSFISNDNKIPEGLMNDVKKNMKITEEQSEKYFGGEENPLLISVRSGVSISIPSMMDIILNFCLNDKIVLTLTKLTKNERFTYDSYRRFISMFSRITLDVPDDVYDKPFNNKKEKNGVKLNTEITSEDMKELVVAFKKGTEE